MRCARCDRIAVPQSVGRTPGGLVVFGWCLDCMEESHCEAVVVAGTRRWRLKTARRQRRPCPRETDPRRKLLSRVALGLVIWGSLCILTACTLLGLGYPRQASPLGNGTPALLLVGGTATGLIGLGFVVYLSAAPDFPRRIVWRVVEWVFFGAAVSILLLAIFRHDPRRNILVVTGAAIALALSAVTHGWRTRHSLQPEDAE